MQKLQNEFKSRDTVVEMFALVEHLDPNARPGHIWTRRMQDVYLEEALYDAFILESVDRGAVDS